VVRLPKVKPTRTRREPGQKENVKLFYKKARGM